MINLLIGLATQVFTFLNTKESLKWLDELTELRLELEEEKEKGQLSDDNLIERLQIKIQIVAEAAYKQIAIHNTKASS